MNLLTLTVVVTGGEVTVAVEVVPGAVEVTVLVLVTVWVVVSPLQAERMAMEPMVAPPTTKPASLRNSLREIFSFPLRTFFLFPPQIYILFTLIHREAIFLEAPPSFRNSIS
jgi:hypothetical protein